MTSPSRSGSSPSSTSSRLTRSCTFVFYIALFASPALELAARAGGQELTRGDPDALYRERAHFANARAASEIWAARLAADSHDFESASKLARAQYWLGTQGPIEARRAALERGTSVSRRATTISPSRPEGYFWMAANMGALAESFGVRQGLKYRGAIKDALETVLRIDPAFQKGSADRALGRWYFKVPGLFGGSNKKSEEHLRASFAYDPDSIASHYFLAETLLDEHRDQDARDEVRRVLEAPVDPDWVPEDEDFKHKARHLLERTRSR